MNRRILAAFLLITVLSVGVIGRQPAMQDESKAEEVKLTPDEEREANAIAKEFIERLENSGDVTPLIKDLYVTDFPELMRGRLSTNFPLAASDEVAAQMSPDDILRAYSASINCMYLASLLYVEWEQNRKKELERLGKTEDSEVRESPKILELIPPDILKLIQSDALLAKLLEHAVKEESDEDNENADKERMQDPSDDESFDNFWPFRSLEDLRHYTSLMEQGIKLLREHVNSRPAKLKPSLKEFMLETRGKSADDDDVEKGVSLRTYLLKEEFMGHSVGTKIICANVLIFHMDLVRNANGQLKVLNAYMMMD